MANTYTQIHIHAIFGVQNRLSLIHIGWRDELYRYITGIIQNHEHKLLQINGTPDHIHVLFGMRPIQSLSELMKDIKGSSSKWINERKLVKGKFSWQEGYGAFSYSKSQLSGIIRYIKGQEEHHRRKSFREEYIDFLNEFKIDYDPKYIFREIR
ncbi:IS200/IS605 family transposase [Saccharicrinis sp. FJH2]|uniref:IS200/IS605 family transposase n=1 Tax=Saccharicrinis sp. FJH65 TaxID=3344659 RepID=UPI0035F2B73D